jgi:hypothetical protein
MDPMEAAKKLVEMGVLKPVEPETIDGTAEDVT